MLKNMQNIHKISFCTYSTYFVYFTYSTYSCPAQVAASPMINNQNCGIRIGIELSYMADTSELYIYQTRQRSHAV